jgi:hypothetical protein
VPAQIEVEPFIMLAGKGEVKARKEEAVVRIGLYTILSS